MTTQNNYEDLCPRITTADLTPKQLRRLERMKAKALDRVDYKKEHQCEVTVELRRISSGTVSVVITATRKEDEAKGLSWLNRVYVHAFIGKRAGVKVVTAHSGTYETPKKYLKLYA